MGKKHLNDEELIEMLRKMPTIQDERPREVIYSRFREEINSNPRTRRRKRKSFAFWPVVATAAAFFLVFILASSLLNQDENLTMMDSGNQEMSIAPDDQQREIVQEEPEILEESPDDPGEVEIKNFGEGNDENTIKDDRYRNVTAIYPEQVDDNDLVVTLAIPDLMAQTAIPISVIVQKNPEKSWVDHYNDVMNQIQENELGLSDYYPYNGILSLDQSGNLRISLESGTASMWGSTGEGLFFDSLDAFRFQNIEQIFLFEDERPGIQTQMFSDPLEIYNIIAQKNYGYMIYHVNKTTYLAPAPGSYESIESAFETMKSEISTHDLKPSIPENVDFTVSHRDKDLNIQFINGALLEENETTLLMLEAILMTAKEFGYTTVTFENTGIDTIDGFDLNHAIPVPVAPNQVELDLTQ